MRLNNLVIQQFDFGRFVLRFCKKGDDKSNPPPKPHDQIKSTFYRYNCARLYDSIATVGESRVWWRADFQSGYRVLKKVL